MKIILIAPVQNGIDQDGSLGLLDAQIGKDAPESLLISAVNVDLAGFIDNTHAIRAGPKIYLAPIPVHKVLGFCRRAAKFGGLSRRCQGVKETVENILKAR